MGSLIVHVVIAHGVQNDQHFHPFAFAVGRIYSRNVFVELAPVGRHQDNVRVFPGDFQPLVNIGGVEQYFAAEILQLGSEPFAVAVRMPAVQLD